MKARKQQINFTHQFIYLNKNGEEVNSCDATKNETIEACKPYANERDDVASVLLLKLSTGKKVGEYVKFIN